MSSPFTKNEIRGPYSRPIRSSKQCLQTNNLTEKENWFSFNITVSIITISSPQKLRASTNSKFVSHWLKLRLSSL